MLFRSSGSPLVTSRTSIVAVALLASLATCACGSSNKEVSYKSGGMTHTFAEGQGSIPKNFPLPIYPGSSTTGSVSAETSENSEDAQFLMLTSKEAPEKIADFYRKQLPSDGWKIENSQNIQHTINISATKDPYDAAVMLSSDGTQTRISLAVSKNTGDFSTPSGDEYVPDKTTPPTD